MPPQLIQPAHILTNKFCDGLPFYLQNRMFERLGIDISRSTMSNWTVQAEKRCGPLMELMYEHLRSGGVINLDETPVQVLKEPGRENTTKSYMWVACRSGTKPAVLFHYAPSRAGKIFAVIVGNFERYLQTDGYAGYNALGQWPRLLIYLENPELSPENNITENAKANKLNPADYLYQLFEKLPHAQSCTDLEALMPWAVSKNAETK